MAPEQRTWKARWDTAVGIAICIACLLGAQRLVLLLHLPIPSGVLGALELLALLGTKVVPLARVASGADLLLSQLGLFFVPALVLALRQEALLVASMIPLLTIIVVSTAVGLAVTGWVATALDVDANPPLADARDGDEAQSADREVGAGT